MSAHNYADEKSYPLANIKYQTYLFLWKAGLVVNIHLSKARKKYICVSSDPGTFFPNLPLTIKLYAIFRIWIHSEPFWSISVKSVTAEVIQML